MPAATQLITSFLGGEISQFAQGRYDRPDYRTTMRVCLNSFPVEIGPWTRRPGTHHAGHTRGGVPGRVMRFDFQASAPITLEFTDGYLRFRNGAVLISTNDTVSVTTISTANPAVLQTAAAVVWVTGDTVVFRIAPAPLLENRQFKVTRVNSTHFSLADALTNAAIDGSTLGLIGTGVVARVQELTTTYTGGSWSTIRAVQAETTDILLNAAVAPQALTVSVPSPTVGANPLFSIAPAVFNDGPYLDPFTNGVQATPSGTRGIITLTLSFPSYSGAAAYAAGSFVTYSGANYKSLIDPNLNNQPDVTPTAWAPCSAGAAINNGLGFLGSDIGRLVRLFSEPAAWLIGSTYAASTAAAPVVVSYNPSGLPGQTSYYQSLTGANIGHQPGSDLTNWQLLPPTAAVWSWGKITGLSNIIDRALAGSLNIGDMTAGGGNAAAFDGNFTQGVATSASTSFAGGFAARDTVFTLSTYVGKNYSGSAGAGQAIKQATVYPSSDGGFAAGGYTLATGTGKVFVPTMFVNLRGKASAPASSADGTLLGTSGGIFNTFTPVTILSNDQTTVWAYVWIEIVVQFTITDGLAVSYTYGDSIAEVSFFSPTGTGTSSGVNVEILGPTLLYTASIVTWRLGVYSNTTGWPTCGVYNDGRLYLGGAVGNRFDACYANGINGGTINFAPTDQFGNVSPANAISYTFNSDGVNQILWMVPDLQGIIMGTLAGEWLVVAPTAGSIAPNNISARNVTKHGSAFIQPCRTEHTIIFAQRFAQKLLEYFPEVFSGKFSAPNLADKAEHLTKPGVAEMAYTSAVTPIVWARDRLGALFGITYKRDSLSSAQPPTFYGWHRHVLGSGRVVESICSGPSTGGDLDALTLVTNDIETGIRHVEIMTDSADEQAAFGSSWFLDDAVTPASTSVGLATLTAPYGSLTVNGLWHLNGKTVQAFCGGLDCGDPGEGKPPADFLVANGAISIPFGDSVTAGAGRGLFTSDFFNGNPQIVVGFTYTSDGQVARLVAQADTGARNGPALGAPSRSHRAAFKFVNAKGVSFGGNFDVMFPCLFKTAGGKDLPVLSTFSGVFFDQNRDDFTYEDSLCWRVTRPFPATITACAQNLRTEDM